MDELRLEDMEIVVAHDYEDWWRLKDCQLLFVRKALVFGIPYSTEQPLNKFIGWSFGKIIQPGD